MAVTNNKLIFKLLGSTLLMFGFGFALVPLYDVFCQVTGINGKVDLTPGAYSKSSNSNREIKIQFIAVNNEAMPWKFKPQEYSMTVKLGQTYSTAYIASNSTANYMVAQAVPSVSPSEAAAYLQKVDCFCFNRQPLEAGERKEMGLAFNILPDMPAHIKTITLSYTLFDITQASSKVLASTN
ncbi:cytochrome c oxidase assembly protein ['Osedax' symbiont bacterium Rs2_46_30_T18]|nr:cytochrome c oxidase assembly protein ['Osedax' symbiont bacterium Rs2_46_30_T18]